MDFRAGETTLSTSSNLAAALVYLRFDDRRRWSDYAMAAGLFVAAVLTKSVTATLPAALLVVLTWRHDRLQWRRVWPLLPWLAAGGAAGLFTAAVERTYVIAGGGSDFALDLVQRCLLAGRVICFYVGKLVWPADLMFIYPRWHIDAFAASWQWLPALGVAALLGVLWWCRRRGVLARAVSGRGAGGRAALHRHAVPRPLALSRSFRSASPMSPTTSNTSPPQVRWRWRRRAWPGCWRAGRPWAGRAFAGLLLAGLGALTWRQCGMYRDVETLYRTTLARNPGSWLAEYNLGTTLRAAGRAPEAIPHFEQTPAAETR